MDQLAPQDLKVCDVCRLLRGDLTLKETRYCHLCDAEICAVCFPNVDWRGVAAMKKAKQTLTEILGGIFGAGRTA